MSVHEEVAQSNIAHDAEKYKKPVPQLTGDKGVDGQPARDPRAELVDWLKESDDVSNDQLLLASLRKLKALYQSTQKQRHLIDSLKQATSGTTDQVLIQILEKVEQLMQMLANQGSPAAQATAAKAETVELLDVRTAVGDLMLVLQALVTDLASQRDGYRVEGLLWKGIAMTSYPDGFASIEQWVRVRVQDQQRVPEEPTASALAYARQLKESNHERFQPLTEEARSALRLLLAALETRQLATARDQHATSHSFRLPTAPLTQQAVWNSQFCSNTARGIYNSMVESMAQAGLAIPRRQEEMDAAGDLPCGDGYGPREVEARYDVGNHRGYYAGSPPASAAGTGGGTWGPGGPEYPNSQPRYGQQYAGVGQWNGHHQHERPCNGGRGQNGGRGRGEGGMPPMQQQRLQLSQGEAIKRHCPTGRANLRRGG
eukprot:gene7692-5_t